MKSLMHFHFFCKFGWNYQKMAIFVLYFDCSNTKPNPSFSAYFNFVWLYISVLLISIKHQFYFISAHSVDIFTVTGFVFN